MIVRTSNFILITIKMKQIGQWLSVITVKNI